MKWIKKGLIIRPTGELDWMVTHAMVPFAERMGGDFYRIYFSGRDRLNRSLIGYAEIDTRVIPDDTIFHLEHEAIPPVG